MDYEYAKITDSISEAIDNLAEASEYARGLGLYTLENELRSAMEDLMRKERDFTEGQYFQSRNGHNNW